MKFTFFEEVFTPQINVSLLIIFLLCLFCFVVNSKLKKYDYRTKPSKLILVLELAIGFINDFCMQNLGKKWKTYAAYLLTLFLYLLIANTSGMFGVTTPTTSWAVTIALSLITAGLIYGTRLKEKGIKGFFKAFAEPVAVVTPLNIIGIITTPMSMSVRLMVNMISSAAFAILLYGLLGPFAVLIAPPFHGIFDIFFGVIQAFVFFLLTLINIQQEIEIEE